MALLFIFAFCSLQQYTSQIIIKMKESLLETNYQTLERIYLAKNKRVKNSTSWVKKFERSTNSAASNRYKQQQKTKDNYSTIASKLSRPQTSTKYKQSTKASMKSLKIFNGGAHLKVQQCFNRNSYDKTIYKSQNTKQNLEVVRKIIQKLKSENNGIVFKKAENKKESLIKKQQYLVNCKTINEIDSEQHLQLKPSLPRFKHYYYTFQKKKTQEGGKNIIKIEQIHKFTRDTSISLSQMRDYNIGNDHLGYSKIQNREQKMIEKKIKSKHQFGIPSKECQYENYKDILQYQSYFKFEKQ